jgi:PEGA domain/Protein kinase domain
VNGEDSLFDVPPAAFGRYKVLQQLGAGTTGLIFRGQDPQTHASVVIKVLRTNLPPKRAEEVAEGLAQLVDRLPSHPALATPLASGLDELGPYLVSSFTPGDSLDAALRNYGPAAIEDLVPRLRLLGEALDAAAHAGFVHGSLHPRDIVVSADATKLGGVGVAPLLARAGVAIPRRRPYLAPEIAGGSDPTAAADQFALAALTFEWLFGRSIDGPAESRVEVPALPGVDRDALSGAFTTALAPDPAARFDSCEAFADGVSAAVISARAPIVAAVRDPELDIAKAEAAAFDWPDPEITDAAEPQRLAEYPSETSAGDNLPLVSPEPSPVAWQPAALSAKQPERFGGGVLILTLIVGLMFGFAAGYMARPRALQHPVLAQPVPQSDVATAPSAAPSPTRPAEATPKQPAEASGKREAAGATASRPGRLLVRSTPSGASVTVDGVPRGVTPLALRDLELGTRTVMVAERGYIADEQRVVLTQARPSRSVEVRLATAPGQAKPSAARRPAPEKPAAPAAAATGSLVVDSRPPGADVTIDGRPGGLTPVVLDAISPGEHVVTIILKGYRPFSTTVRVVAGARARAAASLSVQEQE